MPDTKSDNKSQDEKKKLNQPQSFRRIQHHSKHDINHHNNHCQNADPYQLRAEQCTINQA